jgi:hypothetical protein
VKEPRFHGKYVNYLNRSFAFIDTLNILIFKEYQEYNVPVAIRDVERLAAELLMN